MKTTPYYIQDESDNLNKKNQTSKKKKRKNNFFKYLYLFSFVFLMALWGVSHFIKVYSPDIDVSIGNNSEFTLNDSDVDMEIKTIDERLKWIQTDDNMPTVSVRARDKEENLQEETENEKGTKEKENKNDNKTITAPKPTIKEVKKLPEFSEIKIKEIVPLPKPVVTKVYLGSFSTLEEATKVQEQVSQIEPGINPFIKNVNGRYTVQLGSFVDGNRAGALAEKLKEKGYYPKITYRN